MQHTFNDLEAARIAVEIEKNGAFFYRSAEKLVRDEALREKLHRMAEQEDGHARSFTEMYESLRENRQDEASYTQEESLFLSALASTVVFPGGVMAQAMQGRLDSLTDILQSAIRSEMDSISFYQQVLLSGRNPQFAPTFRRIIHEEALHLQELTRQLEKI